MKKPEIEKPTKLKSGDYILTEDSGWFEIGGLVVYLYINKFHPMGMVVAEIFPPDRCEDEDMLASCAVEAR